MGNRQSAVDWLFQELWETPKDKLNWYAILSKAKEMEKQQIMDAVNEGIKQGYTDYIDTEWGRDNDYNPEQYYNETYE